MKSKQKHLTATLFIILLSIIAMIYFFGCAGSSKRLTPEQQKALADSLQKAHEHKINLNLSLGYEHYKQQRWEKAKKFFKKAADIDTSGIKAKTLYQWLGTCYARVNQSDSAEWAYKKGMEFSPDNPYYYSSLIHIYKIQGRLDEGLELSETLIELDPESANSYKIQGELYRLEEDIDSAIEAYGKAEELDPNDQEIKEILGTLYKQQGDVTELIATLEKVVQQNPEDNKKRIDLAKAYIQAAEYRKASEQLETVISKEPDNINALELLGGSYQDDGQYAKAISTYKKIIEKNPNDKKNLCNLAISYSSAEKYTTALSQIRKALLIDSQYGLAYLTRGMVYENAADKCVARNDNKVTFDDKLVYKMAYDEYQKAKKDVHWKYDANKRIEYVMPIIPQKEDYFMHKNQLKPRSDCYNWIQ